MNSHGDENRSNFIRANTTLQAPPLVPEIKLHLAGEVQSYFRHQRRRF